MSYLKGRKEEVFDRLMDWNVTYVFIDGDSEYSPSNALLLSVTFDILEKRVSYRSVIKEMI